MPKQDKEVAQEHESQPIETHMDDSIDEVATQEIANEMVKLQDELSEWKDKCLRAYADFENTKKRLEKEKMMAVAYSNEGFAKDMLSVMDSFDGAMTFMGVVTDDNSSEMIQKIQEGVEKTHEQLKKMLEKNGICEIDCDSSFDPSVHQAIMQVEDETKESGSIVQVLQKGYTIRDQVLRPAMVSTAK